MKMHPSLKYWTPDEAAECLTLPRSLYAKLWSLLDEIPKEKRVPLGGDGSNGTVEYPPEPDAFMSGKMGAVWKRLDPEEQAILNKAVEDEIRYRESLCPGLEEKP